MTQPAQPQRTVSTEELGLLDEIVERRTQDRTIAQRSLDEFQETLAQHRSRIEASIKLTYPEDWVVYETPDGKKLCYLQDDGCERVEPIWEIEFAKLDLMQDVLEEDLEIDDGKDRHKAYTVQMSGRCRVTGSRGDELGFRSTGDGFFAKQWLAAKHEPATRARLAANVRKSAMVNAKGRLVRRFTGLGGVPMDVLASHGLDTNRCRGIKFESGTQGGSGDGPNVPQLRALAGAAAMAGKVEGFSKNDFNKLVDTLQSECRISKRDASALIDELKALKEPMQKATFWKRVGYQAPEKKSEAPPATGGDVAPAAGSQEAGPSVLDEKGVCRECERDVAQYGHSKACPYAQPPT